MNARQRRRAIQRVRGRVIASWVMLDASTSPRTWIAIDRSDEAPPPALRGSSPALARIEPANERIETALERSEPACANPWIAIDRSDEAPPRAPRGSSPALERIEPGVERIEPESANAITLTLPVDHTLASSWGELDHTHGDSVDDELH